MKIHLQELGRRLKEVKQTQVIDGEFGLLPSTVSNRVRTAAVDKFSIMLVFLLSNQSVKVVGKFI
jgi:hypothetical protein